MYESLFDTSFYCSERRKFKSPTVGLGRSITSFSILVIRCICYSWRARTFSWNFVLCTEVETTWKIQLDLYSVSNPLALSLKVLISGEYAELSFCSFTAAALGNLLRSSLMQAVEYQVLQLELTFSSGRVLFK